MLILQTLQRGDLRLQPRGNLLKFLRLRRLRLLQVLHGGLLFGFGSAAFGLEELLLGVLDLNIHFLRRRRKFLQRRRAENILPVLHGQGGKVGNHPFYFFSGTGIDEWLVRDGRRSRRLCACRRRDGLPGGWLAGGLEAGIARVVLRGDLVPKDRDRNPQEIGNQREQDDPKGSLLPRS